MNDKSTTFENYSSKRMADNDQEKGKPIPARKGLLNSYAKYSAMGFQMFLVIGVFTYAGYKIDEGRQAKMPLATAFLSLAGVFIALYLIIRSIKKIKS
jgi:hypothetical protein